MLSEHTIKEKVASGLRRMGSSPDFLLFCDADSDWVWDKENILGIPVLHSDFMENRTTDWDVPFIPLWRRPINNKNVLDRKRFNDGYKEAPNAE